MNKHLFHNMVAQYGTKTVTGIDSLEWSDGVKPCYLPSLKFYGGCSQGGTPTPDAPVNIYDHTGVYVLDGRNDYIYLPNLRGVGEYRDEWDYVTGKGIRRIGIKVLDGTEGWAKYHYRSEGYYSYRLQVKSFNNTGGEMLCICTHYKPITSYGTLYFGRDEGAYVGGVTDTKSWLIIGNSFPTVAEFKGFLAEQYANGTPVTVYYVMAEPIPFEERNEWDIYQPIPNDSGRITWGDGNVSGTPIEATYVVSSSGFKRVTLSSNDGIIEWSGGVRCNLPSLKFYGDIKASTSNYSYDNPRVLYANDGGYQIYAPLGEPLLSMSPPKLRRVGDYKDEWDFCTGKVKRHIKEIVFDGRGEYGEKIVSTPAQRNDTYYVRYTPQYPITKGGLAALTSTHFKAQWAIADGNIYAVDKERFCICHKDLSTTDEWNAWLANQYDAGSPVRIWYAMAEPIEEYEVGGTLPNESGRVEMFDGTSTNHPLEVTYITHS